MKKAVTKRQKELLSIIYQHISNTGFPPAFDEMREELDVISNQSIVDLLAKLIEQGCIRRRPSAARGISFLPYGYEALGRPPLAPMLGTTTAGTPAEAIELIGEWQTLSGNVARFAEDVFLLKISGDSMINAGIDDGDAVLVQSKKYFVSGEIVLAYVGDEATVKRFISEDKPPYTYLKPENPNHDIIFFKDDVELKGKVISVLKQGQWLPLK